MSPLSTTFAGLSAKALGFTSRIIGNIYDAFARTNSGPLGTANTGQTWNATSGTWEATNGTATAVTAPSSYPISTINYQTNVNETIQNATPGAGLVFWLTDAGDYWAVVTNVIETSVQSGSTCVPNSCCSTSTPYNSCCSSTQQCTNGYWIGSGVNAVYVCESYSTVCYAGYCGSQCNSNNCCSSSPNYTYTWTFYLNLIQSVASSITQIASNPVASNNTGSLMINSLRALTSGTSVIGTAYSDGATTTPIGTVTATNPSSPTGTKVGIIMKPIDSSDSGLQGTTVGPYSAQP